MNDSILVIIAVLVVVSLISGIYIFINRGKESLNYDEIVGLFNKGDIIKLEYIRNKIVVTFKDIQLFNVNELKSKGAKGINIIGDKIKFFVSDDKKVNEEIFNEINKTFEG